MQESEFWRLIESAKQADGQDPLCERQIEILQEQLEALTPEEIIDFARIFEAFLVKAYRWDLWGAAVIINGGASDDGFEYFRRWLIGQGEAIYTRALKDPDSLADLPILAEEEAECEELPYVADEAYKIRTGKDIDYQAAGFARTLREPAGEKWEEEDLDTMFPRLAVKYAE